MTPPPKKNKGFITSLRMWNDIRLDLLSYKISRAHSHCASGYINNPEQQAEIPQNSRSADAQGRNARGGPERRPGGDRSRGERAQARADPLV